MGIIEDVKKVLAIKLKPRRDSYSDQYSRILMLKIMLFGAFFTGLSWYKDSIVCIVPKNGPAPWVDPAFVAQSCWINGLYVYEEIRNHNNDIGYYGLPRKINLDGRRKNGELCQRSQVNVQRQTIVDETCIPMRKTFFLQFQYMTFFMMVLGALYYSPYTLFRFVNSDLMSLKGVIKTGSIDDLVKHYFNHKINPVSKLNCRLFGNLICKILYIIVNLLGFFLMDTILNGRFQTYGTEWVQWAETNNTMMYDYMGRRDYPKPGEALLPTFGFCEIYEMAEDVKMKIQNKHRYVCELSQHVLYQYILMIMWWAMVVGICVSVVGLLMLFVDFAISLFSIRKSVPKRRSKNLTLREYEYLAYIRRKNIALFGKVLEKLKEDSNEDETEMAMTQPFYKDNTYK